MAPHDPPDGGQGDAEDSNAGDSNVGDDDSGDEHDLFAGIPILGDILRMQARPDSAALAGSSAQLAHLIATGGKPEPNIDPLDRVALSELARVAELHVAKVTGLDPTSSGAPAAVEPVTRSQWAATAVTACRPLTDRIAERLRADEPDDESNDPAAVMNFLMRTLNPTLVSVCGGAMAGQLSQTAFGDCDLPVARTADAIGVVTANVADFAQQWSLEPDDVRLWVCIRELALHSVFAVDHVRAAVDELIEAYVDGFRLDPAAAQRQLAEQLESTVSSIDGPLDPSAIQQQAKLVFGNPEVLLGTSRTAGQEALAERLESRLGLIAAYVDHVLAAAGSGLIAGYDSLTEALRRRRTADTPGERYANRLLGVGVGGAAERASAEFVAGVLDRAGDRGLALLWSDAEHWPTPNEVAAPGLWLERIEISADAADAGSVGGDAGSAGGDAGSAGGGENSAGGA